MNSWKVEVEKAGRRAALLAAVVVVAMAVLVLTCGSPASATVDFTSDVTGGVAPLTVNFANASDIPPSCGLWWVFGDDDQGSL